MRLLAGPLVVSLIAHVGMASFLVGPLEPGDSPPAAAVVPPIVSPALRRIALAPKLDVVVASAHAGMKSVPVRVDLLVVRELPKKASAAGDAQAIPPRRLQVLLKELRPPKSEPPLSVEPRPDPRPTPRRGLVLPPQALALAKVPMPVAPPPPAKPPPTPPPPALAPPLEVGPPDPIVDSRESSPIPQSVVEAPPARPPPEPAGTPLTRVEPRDEPEARAKPEAPASDARPPEAEITPAPVEPSKAPEPKLPEPEKPLAPVPPPEQVKAPEPPPPEPPKPEPPPPEPPKPEPPKPDAAPPALAGEPPSFDLRRLELTRQVDLTKRGEAAAAGSAAARRGEAAAAEQRPEPVGGAPASALIVVSGGGGGERRPMTLAAGGLAVRAPEEGPGGAPAVVIDRAALARMFAASSFRAGTGTGTGGGPPRRRSQGAPVAAQDATPGARFVAEGGRGRGLGEGAGDGEGGPASAASGAPEDARTGGASRTGAVLLDEPLVFIQGRVQTIATLGRPSHARGLHGTALVRIQMNRGGYLTRYELLRSSGYPVLDDELPQLLALAAPFPFVEDWVVLSVAF